MLHRMPSPLLSHPAAWLRIAADLQLSQDTSGQQVHRLAVRPAIGYSTQDAWREMRKCHQAGKLFHKTVPIRSQLMRRWLGVLPGEKRWHEVSVSAPTARDTWLDDLGMSASGPADSDRAWAKAPSCPRVPVHVARSPATFAVMSHF